MSRRRVLSAVCAGGALVLGVGINSVSVGAAQKSATATRGSTATTVHRGYRTTAQPRSPRVAGADYVIGVDAPPPPGHNFQYTDYFPRSGLNIHAGQVI